MNKTKSINRAFLVMLLWALAIPLLFRKALLGMTTIQLSVVSEILLSLPILFYILIKRIKPNEWIPFRRISLSIVFMSALLGFLLLPLTTFINLFSLFFSTNYVSESSAQMLNNPLWLNLLVIAVIPAVVEELIYRGVVYHAYREKGVIMAILASGIVFGIMHRNLNQFCYALVLGCIFGILVEITGSIFASMVAHFVINGWNVLLMAVQKPLQAAAGSTGVSQTQIPHEMLLMAVGVYGVFALIATSLAVCVMIWMTKHCKREAHMRWCFRKHELPEGVSRSFVTPAFVAAVIIAFIYMIMIELF